MYDQTELKHQLITRRGVLIIAAKCLLLLVLIGRLFYLQIIQNQHWRKKADSNRVKLAIKPLPRGIIRDRTGEIIADNQIGFRVLISSRSKEKVSNTVHKIGELVGWDKTKLSQAHNQLVVINRRQYIIQRPLDWQEMAILKEYQYKLPDVTIAPVEQRKYSAYDVTGHLLGYVGWPKGNEPYPNQLKNHYNFKLGKYGLERQFDKKLQSKPQLDYFEVNAHGNEVRNLKTIAGEEAKDLQLSIDLELQRQAASQIGDRAGSVILSDITTGEILVAYSSPNLNSNLLSSGDNSYWAHINQDESIPLINRLTRGLYSPASAFKVVVALAALEAGIDPNARFYCSGEIQIGNRVFHCLKKSGHGHVNCQEAIASSCNIYVWELALRVGFDRIEQMARKLGFGSSVGLFNDEKTGLLPTREWKKKQYQQSWLLGDTVNFAIGQGYLLSTPLQLWRMISLIAGRGNFVEPRLTKVGTGEIAPKPSKIITLNTKSFDAVHQGMVAGVNKPYGTSYRFSLHNPKWQVAGKTGTVQIVSKRDAGPNHAVFVGYAPAHKPRYATSIVVEKSGYGGKVAAPIALGLFRMLMNRNT